MSNVTPLEVLINPITGQQVDEIIKEKEAKSRGYFELEFILRHLEDDNEFVKYFIVDGKKIVVDLDKPMTQYKKPTQINHERVVSDTCGIDEPECLSCGS